MDLFLAISEGIGASLAAGVRASIAALVVGVLARANAGVDFEGTDYAFLESVWWLAAMVALVALTTALERRAGATPFLAAAAAAIGALLFAGSLTAEGHPAGAGLAAGAACASLAFVATRAFLGGAESRVATRGGAGYIELFALCAALAIAALAVLVPSVSYLLLAFCIWVLAARRRRAGRKYEGLRILR